MPNVIIPVCLSSLSIGIRLLTDRGRRDIDYAFFEVWTP